MLAAHLHKNPHGWWYCWEELLWLFWRWVWGDTIRRDLPSWCFIETVFTKTVLFKKSFRVPTLVFKGNFFWWASELFTDVLEKVFQKACLGTSFQIVSQTEQFQETYTIHSNCTTEGFYNDQQVWAAQGYSMGESMYLCCYRARHLNRHIGKNIDAGTESPIQIKVHAHKQEDHSGRHISKHTKIQFRMTKMALAKTRFNSSARGYHYKQMCCNCERI